MQGREEGRDPVSAARASVKKEANPKAVEPVSFVCLDAHREVEVVKNLYDSLSRSETKMWRADRRSFVSRSFIV